MSSPKDEPQDNVNDNTTPPPTERSNDTLEDSKESHPSTPHQEDEPSTETHVLDPSPEDVSNAWTQTWDEQSREYYWWNTVTNETAWDDPRLAPAPSDYQDDYADPTAASAQNKLDDVLDTIDATVKAQLDGQAAPAVYPQAGPRHTPTSFPSSSYSSASAYGEQDPYKFQAYFNSKTGRFQTTGDLAQRHPGQFTQEFRAQRQMEAFFDVNAYQEERNVQHVQNDRKRPLSRKEVERFKKAKKEKKLNRMREWLRD
ncbi:hypothetical protein DM01DRAFT_1331820 [Hesseltinella vesiculosa]|uniref:WW domain-containing protein n=1 Tax=Hesseltinella vesiculosa TaxID=101127 RepID=A0A1X2GWH7_9FUNG|nr:hypothetical protein DM01DRAFT_1331820 [Hesseltinella vesiculosa]